jgi:hypothetical protein
MWHAGRGGKSVEGFGGKDQRKETTWKTEAFRGGWIKMDLREISWEGVWSGFTMLRMGTSGRLS